MPTTVIAAVLHPHRRQVLVHGATPSSLPTARLDTAHWHADHGPLTEAISGVVGRPLRLLRRLGQQVERDPTDDDALTTRRLLFLAELEPDAGQPGDPGRAVSVAAGEASHDGWAWADLDQLGRLEDPWLRSTLEALAPSLGMVPSPALRPPWAVERSRYWAELGDWVKRSLVAEGRRASGPLRPVKVWCLAAVYRQETDGGPVYVKVAAPAPPLFVDEAAVTLALAKLFPRQLPRVLAALPGPGWLLLEDEGDTLWAEGPSSEAVERDRSLRLARAHADLQVAGVDHVDALLAAGCVDRRLERLAAAVAPLLDDPLTARVLGLERSVRLRAAQGEIYRAIDRYAALDLPASLVHGDLHLGNVLWRGEDPIIIDWTDACVGPPMVDLIALSPDADAGLAKAWRETYIGAWQQLLPRGRLEAAWDLNAILLPLHHSVSYLSLQQHIEGSDAGDMEGGLEQYAPRLAEALGL